MYNEKSNKIRWIAVITAFVLILAGVITSLAIAIQNKPVEAKANDTVSDAIEQPAETPTDNENHGLVSLRMSPSYAAARQRYLFLKRRTYSKQKRSRRAFAPLLFLHTRLATGVLYAKADRWYLSW